MQRETLRFRDKLGFAVVGCGTVSGYGHLPAIQKLSDSRARLEAIVDANKDTLKQTQEKYQCANAWTDYKQALNLDTVDVVVIATLIDTHAPFAINALRAGKHVLVEKPPARDPAECRMLLEEAEKADRICAVDFDKRYMVASVTMRDQLRKGAIGKLRAIRIVCNWAGPSHQRKLNTQSSSAMEGEGIHHVDLVRWISGSEFGKVYCVGTNVCGYASPDHMALVSVLRDGTVVNIETSVAHLYAEDFQMDLIGEAGVIKWVGNNEQVTIYTKAGRVDIEAGLDKRFVPLYNDLIDSVLQDRPVRDLPTIQDGYEAQKVTYEADRAAQAHGSNK